MNEKSVMRATGRTLDEWFRLIEREGMSEASHKRIAAELHKHHGASAWWAQEITVAYEKHIGRRVLGQTADGLFQIGVSKTVDAPAEAVWKCLESREGISLITSCPKEAASMQPGTQAESRSGLKAIGALDGTGSDGVKVLTTTFAAGSHVRMRWKHPQWPHHSILQIRVTPKTKDKSLLAFHQEKMPSQQARAAMREHWRDIADRLSQMARPTAGSGDHTGG